MTMRSALWLPIFDELADPVVVARIDLAPYAKTCATWWMAEFPWDAVSVDAVRGVLREGPA